MQPIVSFRRMSGPGRGGFMLLEVMLALGIFCLVVVGLARSLGSASSAMLSSNREAQVRLGLQSRLSEIRILPVTLGVQDDTPDVSGITFQHEWKQLTMQNATGTSLTDLYQLIERAHWVEGGENMSQEASIYLYLPPQ